MPTETPLEKLGPFKYRYAQGHHQVLAKDGHIFVELTGQLIDGSCRPEHPDGVIRSREQRGRDAAFVLEALNMEWHRRFGGSPQP